MSDFETPPDPAASMPEPPTTPAPSSTCTPPSQDDAPPLFECIYTGECASVSGRSMLTYAIGRHPDQSLHLRIVANSGRGMFCGDWAAGDRIDALVAGEQALTSRSFGVLHPGKSINTGGFVMSALRHLGLIRLNPENSRFHEHVPGMNFAQVAVAAVGHKAAAHTPRDIPQPSRKARMVRPLPKGLRD